MARGSTDSGWAKVAEQERAAVAPDHTRIRHSSFTNPFLATSVRSRYLPVHALFAFVNHAGGLPLAMSCAAAAAVDNDTVLSIVLSAHEH